MWWSEIRSRRAMLAALAGLAGAGLGGCGFALRQPPRLPFAGIALTGFAPRSPLAEELREQLALQVRVLDAPDKADVVLQALEDSRERSVVASTASAEVREFQLRLRFVFRAHTPGGRELIPRAELRLWRDLNFSENAALAKEFEQEALFRDMQSDVVLQVLRRLAAVQV
jgi:LPS-assembly lipoprotein